MLMRKISCLVFLTEQLSLMQSKSMIGQIKYKEEKQMRAILNKDSRKDKIITIRCAEEERSMLERKANQQQKSLSEYMLDSGMAGVERRRNRDRKRVQQMIENQETLNDLFLMLEDMEKRELPTKILEKIEEAMEGDGKLWRY